MPRKTIRMMVDELCDWYEKFNPERRQTICVKCRPATLKKFCEPTGVKALPFRYRGRFILATKPYKRRV